MSFPSAREQLPTMRRGLRLLAQRAAAQVLEPLLSAWALGVDLQHLLPGLIGTFPVLPRLGDRRERLECREATRLALQRRLKIGNCSRCIARGKPRDGA